MKKTIEKDGKAFPTEIYAEISHKLLGILEKEGGSFNLPEGVKLNRRPGKRACFFEVESGSAMQELTNKLDEMGINWQENY